MLIAFTYNLQMTQNEDEAEFDRPETVEAIAASLTRLGHQVELVEVSGPASRIVARLEALKPQLVFNTAEGKYGRYREAFYPGLFDQLGLPFTGSDAYVCSVTLDKRLTKMMLSSAWIPTPQYYFVDNMSNWNPPELRFPVILKPNFEGSSKGITQDSIVDRLDDVKDRAEALLKRYPSGVLIEEFIAGKDVTVPFLEAVRPKTGGILPPAEYIIATEAMQDRKYNIYDFELKQFDYESVSVRVPAEISHDAMREIMTLSKRIYEILGVRDLGRVDFRVTPDGKPYFIELNALPSLEPGAGIYISAGVAGLHGMDAVMSAVIKNAAKRQGVEITKSRSRLRRKSYRVGLTYNLKRIIPLDSDGDDSEAEYDSPTTVEAIGNAIESFGHDVVFLEATPELPAIIGASSIDFAFNIAEGIQGRSRESQVPAILELLDIPYIGSDPATMSIALDKALCKKILTQAGIPNPKFFVMRTGNERIPKEMSFPLLVKPVAEGSSKGVMAKSAVEDENQLREVAGELIRQYKQSVLVEEFLVGREFTVGLLGDYRPKVLPPMEIIFNNPEVKRPVYSFDHKQKESPEIRYQVPAQLDAKLLREIEKVARGAFNALGCRDVARVDIRLDNKGKPYFIECNPLPGLTPEWSDLCLIAKAAGMDYRTLIGEIMAPSIRRLREKEKLNAKARMQS